MTEVDIFLIMIGGGGERVLWSAIHGILEAKLAVQIVLYVSNEVPLKDDLVKLVNVRYSLHYVLETI